MKIVLDRSRAPLVVVRLPEEVSVDELRRYFHDEVPQLLHMGRIAALVDASETRPLAFSSEHREVTAHYYKKHRSQFSRVLVCEAFILPSAVARGVLRVVQMLSPPAWETKAFGSYSEARAYCESKLRLEDKMVRTSAS